MKIIEKFTTIDDLKSSQKTSNRLSSLRKHTNFEKVIKEIVSANNKKAFKNKAGK